MSGMTAMMKYWALLSRMTHSRVGMVPDTVIGRRSTMVVVASAVYMINKQVHVVESPTPVGGQVSAQINNVTIPQWKPLPDSPQVRHEMPQPHRDILTQIYQADLFILAEDNVYGDCNESACFLLREIPIMPLFKVARHCDLF
jgi:hypothetical protein